MRNRAKCGKGRAVAVARTRAGLDIILRCYQREIISGHSVTLDIHVNNGYIFRLCNIEIQVCSSHVLFL